jgi:succinate dehydrogenase / fumarate reductase cytochrome b subunit
MAKAGWSSVAKKLLNGLTGLGLIVFVILHLGGNLTLLSPNPDTFNAYAHKLTGLGFLLYAAEIGLLLLFLAHIVSALAVWVQNRGARSERYHVSVSRGKPSRKSVSSVTMIYTGLILFAFVVWHVVTFRFGPGISDGYVTYINGEEARDLHRLVVEFFSNPINVVLYVAVMILLGFHLRHGFWSAFQSIGVNHPKYSPFIYALGIAAAFVLAIGFLILPVWLYFRGGA